MLDDCVAAHVLENSPHALSVGRLCVEMGCTCIWEGFNSKPRVIDKNGNEIPIHVRSFVPYMSNVAQDMMVPSAQGDEHQDDNGADEKGTGKGGKTGKSLSMSP